MTYTTNFELKKPGDNDFYDIGDHNDNMDVIDEAMGDFYEELEEHETTIANNEKALCRTNLLDNWYFPNAVNQRGETSWDSSYIGMTIDRWKKTGTYSGVALSSAGIKINPTGMNYVTSLLQYIDSKTYEAIKNKKITFSVVCSGVERSAGYEVKVTFMNIGTYSGSSSLYNGINSFTLQGPTGDYPTSSKPYIGISVSGSGEVNIIAVKLEVGENQTLARQVNGEWVLNDVPNYDEQLLRCKRFYQIVKGGSFVGYIYGTSSSVQVTCTLPLEVDMDESIASVTATRDSAPEIILPTTEMTPVRVTDVSAVSKIQGSVINNPTDGFYDVLITPYSSLTSKYGYFIIVRKLKVILSTEE